MAVTTIDTTSNQYQNYLTGLQTIVQTYKPRLRLYFKLPKDKREQWRAADPILDLLLKIAGGIGNLQGEIDA